MSPYKIQIFGELSVVVVFFKCGHMYMKFIILIIWKCAIQWHWDKSLAQSCPTLCDPVDCSPPGSSVHGILQARILEWVAVSFSRGSSRPRDRTRVSCVAGRCFNLWATRCAENVVQPLALSISRTFSLSQTETLCGLRSHFPPSLQSLVTSILLAEFFYSMYFI